MSKNKLFLFALVGLLTISFSFQSRFFEIAKQIEIYNNLFKTLNMNYVDEINPAEITKKAINNTLENLDPYTRFYNEQQVEDAMIRREGEYGGIGISSFYVDEGIVVAAIKKGFPADKAGLKPGDVITKVNNQVLAEIDKEQFSQLLKGIPNTPVSISVNRSGKNMSFELLLDKIIDNPVPFFDMIDEETGYIVLTNFTSDKATLEVKNAFISLKEKGMKKLVFDLRNNPGGSLYDAINITNIFIPKDKKVVDTRGKTQANSKTYKTNRDPLDTEIPIVVLINGRSASASEIVSGALQDYDRAVIMGERSFGKGLVQRYFKLNYGTQMKATISKYYTPSGRCIQELDYANRDEKTGKIPKFSEGTINTFTTANGRKVYDGGGILPDVAINISERTEETKQLLKSRAVFNFVTDYVINNPAVDIKNFSFTSSDFNDFKSYLINKDTSFVTEQEALFKKAFKSLKNNSVASEYNQIINKLKQDKVAEISKSVDIITEAIEDDILERSFYEEGVFQYHLQKDNTIKKAVALLNNSKEYNKILGY